MSILELNADGVIRDADTGEHYGHVPASLRELYGAAAEMLTALERVSKLAALKADQGYPLPAIVVQAVNNAIRNAGGTVCNGKHKFSGD